MTPLTAEEIAEWKRIDTRLRDHRAGVIDATFGLLPPARDLIGMALHEESLRRLLDDVERARALLKRIEWVHGDCPACGGGRPFFEPEPDEEPVSGHVSGCELAALLS